MCTEFGIKMTDPSLVSQLWAFSGRNMDWLGNTQGARLVPYRAGVTLGSKAPDGTDGLQWETIIDALPITAYLDIDVVDGENAEGLTYAANMLDCSVYPSAPLPDKYGQTLGIPELGLWALTQFATVDDVIQAFRSHINNYVEYSKIDGEEVYIPYEQSEDNKIYLYQSDVMLSWETPGLHVSFRDKEGKAFIVEFLKGKVVGYTYENAYVWTMTNDPPLPQQINNLATYNHLDGGTPPPISIYGQPIKLDGTSNMAGLPGSASPEDRFVRVAKKIQNLPQPKNPDEALTAVMNIADAAKVSKGDAYITSHGKTVNDQTIFQVFRDSLDPTLYYRTDADSQLRKISIKLLFDTKEELKPILLHQSTQQTVVDMTNCFLKA